MATTSDFLTVPFTILIDDRERLKYDFRGLRSDARQGRRELIVPTRVTHLATGDYQIEGCPGIAIERKSLADLFSTLGQGRRRFERELARLAELEFAAVVIEAEWSQILDGYEFSRLAPKTMWRSVLAWMQRYRTVHWLPVPGRRMAEVATFRILERWWRDHNP